MIQEALGLLSLRPLLRVSQAYPLRRIPERSLGEVLEDVLDFLGDFALEEVLKTPWAARFYQLASPSCQQITVRKALARRYRPLLHVRNGFTKLRRSKFRELKPYERGVISEQLGRFIDLLEQGETVQLEPEGAVSTDGRFSRFRQGLHILLNKPHRSPRVLPVGVTYDFMTQGRPWVFVNLGPEMTDLRGLSYRETNARVADAIFAQATLTATQLASEYLLTALNNSWDMVTFAQLEAYVAEESSRHAAKGLYVDPRLLQKESREERLGRYLDYCVRSAMLIPKARGYYLSDGIEMPAACWPNPLGTVDYAHNELVSLLCRQQDPGLDSPTYP